MEFHSRVFVFTLVLFASCLLHSEAYNVSYDNRAITIDGQRRILISGAIHYPRSTPGMWPSLIRKAKLGGLNTIETYVFWNAHEPRYREYDFSANLDLVRFLRTIQEEGLYAILRIGPYVCAEWNYGGVPVWLHNMPNVTFRTYNEGFMNEMKIFTTLIVNMVRRQNLFASNGGPIILAQIENEYGNVMWKYGDDGHNYINWCANFAESLDVGVPWIMCQQGDAPAPMINTCNGWYCDSFTPHPNLPKLWTENWTGWFKKWGGGDPHRTAEDLAFAVARFYQYRGTLQNYYMYHGGTNFDRSAGGPYITTTYDYDAPLDEYGLLNEPKWGHLKDLHRLLISYEKVLTYGNYSDISYPRNTGLTVYSYQGRRVCFIGNPDTQHDQSITYEGRNYNVPAWSVSILPECETEAYNTARITGQTSIKEKKYWEFTERLRWKWNNENFEDLHTEKVRGVFKSQNLVDQKFLNDTSDYLWYMTSVEFDRYDPIFGHELTLHVETTGHVLHAFVNGKHVGTEWSKGDNYNFVFEQITNHMKRGLNTISLLSVLVGLENYGPMYEQGSNGILGPVKLIAPNGLEKDLSTNGWSYKAGIDGINEKKLYSNHKHYPWHQTKYPVNKMFVWYKTSFESPVNNDPVVLDLQGMGKGIAWVNGRNIGRYWPSFFAHQDGCSSSCDYRGAYSSNKCVTNCGNPSQRWYHVPRSFLYEDEPNTLILFEEFGGNPFNVKVQTVGFAKVCGNVHEGNKLKLSCHGRSISKINFASFGDPQGSCGSFQKGSCESPNSLSIVERECLGEEKCQIDVSDKVFGISGCAISANRLAVEVQC